MNSDEKGMSDWSIKQVRAILDEHGEYWGWAVVAAALRQARMDALEEAAKMIEERWLFGVGDHYATAIRALKEKTP